MTQPKRVIATGGPGAGKTTVLNALKAHGHHVIEESARSIIRERLARGLPPRPAPREFALKVMQRDIANYRSTESRSDLVLFDRGLLDGVGMLGQTAALDTRKVAALNERYIYHNCVFIFPPWPEIYQNDAERDQSFFDAIRIFELLDNLYRLYGYKLIEVPKTGVADRCNFVLHTLGLS